MLTAAPEPLRQARIAGRRWLLPVALAAVIATWQFSFNSASPESRRSYAMTASMGMCEDATRFFYFFYHYGLFPVGALEVPRPLRILVFGGATNSKSSASYFLNSSLSAS